MSKWFRSYGFADVHDKLLVGAYPLDREDVSMLEWMKIERVLNLVEDTEYERGEREQVRDALYAAGIEEHRLSLTDYGRLPAPQLEQAVGEIMQWLDEGHRVYVHCRAGWQRSAAVAAGVVAVREGVSIDDALIRVRRRKPSAEPLPEQREDLLKWWAERDHGEAEEDAAELGEERAGPSQESGNPPSGPSDAGGERATSPSKGTPAASQEAPRKAPAPRQATPRGAPAPRQATPKGAPAPRQATGKRTRDRSAGRPERASSPSDARAKPASDPGEDTDELLKWLADRDPARGKGGGAAPARPGGGAGADAAARHKKTREADAAARRARASAEKESPDGADDEPPRPAKGADIEH